MTPQKPSLGLATLSSLHRYIGPDTSLQTAASPCDCADVQRAVPFHRAYNPDAGSYFYTTNTTEFTNAINNLGYRDEGIDGFIFPSSERGTVPFFRMLKPSLNVHFYTIDTNEVKSSRQNLGYRDDGIAGFVYPRSMCTAIPLFRMVRGWGYFYTTSATERNYAGRGGWGADGTAAWVLPTNEAF